MSDDKDPKEILLDIHDRVKRLEDELIADDAVRFDLDDNTKAHKVLQCVKNNPASTVKDVEEATGYNDASAQLTRWYRYRLLERDKKGGVYRYFINQRGVKALEGDHDACYDGHESDTTKRSPSEEPDEKSNTQPLQPWQDSPISRCKWIAIHLVEKYDGRPETTDLQDEYVQYGFDSKKSLTSQVTRLYKDGYLVRTPWQPYKYDISEKGVGLLDKYGVDDIERYKE